MSRGAKPLLRSEGRRQFVHVRAVDLADAIQPADSWIDLEQLRGTAVWMRSRLADHILGSHPRQLERLAQFGILPSRETKAKSQTILWVQLAPSWSMEDVRNTFESRWRDLPETAQNSEQNKQARRALGILRDHIGAPKGPRLLKDGDEGVLLARRSAVDCEDETGEWIDVRSLCGHPRWMRSHIAAQILGKTQRWVIRAGTLNLLSIERRPPPRSDWWVLFDPAWTIDAMRKRYLLSVVAPTTYAEWENYDRSRRALGMTAEDPHFDGIEDAALAFLEDLNHLVERTELNGIVALPSDEPTRLIRKIYRRRGDLRRARADASPMNLESFRLILPQAIAHAPGTCFDDSAVERPAPPDPILGRLAALRTLRDPASFALLRLAGRNVTLPFMEEIVRAFERLDKIVTSASWNWRDAESMHHMLVEYGLSKTLVPDELPAVRDLTVRTWLWMTNELKAAAELSTRTRTHDLREFAPPPLAGEVELKRDLHRLYGHLRPAGVARRKRISNELSDKFDLALAVARRRCDQLADFADDGVEEARALSASSDDWRDWETPGHVLDEQGEYLPGLQTIDGRVWREEALWRHLEEQGALRNMPAVRQRVLQSSEMGGAAAGQRLWFQFRGVSSETGDPAVEPFFATIFRVGAPVAPASLELEMKERRAELIKRWRMPGYVCPRSGLLSFDQEGNTLFRLAALAGMVLIPLEEFDHAMRIGHLAFRAAAITGCRANELQQMAVSRARWPIVECEDQAFTGWLAIPKQDRHELARAPDGSPERFFMVDDDTYRYFSDLAAVLSRRCHSGGSIPAMDPAIRLEHKCGRAPYVFSMDGVALPNGAINDCMRYLLAGVIPTTMHPIRHSSANRGWIEGDPLEDVMVRLNQRTLGKARHYARLSKRQEDEGLGRFLQRRTGRAAMRLWRNAT